ncbi:MAG: DUF4097 domain-containing protein [Acidobacteria bacterium]|nr:DUF4097 domain-containing protein [Acidobacteriota bacterium]
MRIKSLFPTLGFPIVAAAILGEGRLPAQTRQNPSPSLKCSDRTGSSDRERFCEMREQTLAASATLDVDAGINGGITVKGWDRADILVRSRVDANAPTRQDAEQLVRQVKVEAAGGRVRPVGPDLSSKNRNGENSWWSTSFEIFLPRKTGLELKAFNGGINIDGIEGKIGFPTLNGGVNLNRVAGDVRGKTVNGGLTVQLAGDRWNGAGLDVQTTNGGVHMRVPGNYNAMVSASTVNGGIHSELPAALEGRRNKTIDLKLGTGGAPIRLTTTNGGVQIKRDTI